MTAHMESGPVFFLIEDQHDGSRLLYRVTTDGQRGLLFARISIKERPRRWSMAIMDEQGRDPEFVITVPAPDETDTRTQRDSLWHYAQRLARLDWFERNLAKG